MDEIPEVPPSSPEIAVEPYRSFPTFEDFSSAGFESETLDRFVAVLENVKSSAGQDQLQNALNVATKWAAIDTGAIEGLYQVDRGFTFTVAAQAAAWDTIHLTIGDEAQRAIHDALTAYDYVLDMATQNQPISEAWIRDLHAVICKSQEYYSVVTDHGPQKQELPKGQYKSFPNNPFNPRRQSVHSYAPVDDTAAEMARLMDEIRADSFALAHPVLQAAYAHYAFVCIHPFADGNGRVSRAMASIFLYRSPGVPLVIFADQQGEYLDALESADSGNYGPFIGFIGERALDTVRIVTRDMRRVPQIPLDEGIQHLRRQLQGRGGLPHTEVDAMALQVVDAFAAAMDRAMEKLSIPEISLSRQWSGMTGVRNLPAAYRVPSGSRAIQVIASSPPPGDAQLVRDFYVVVAKGSADIPDFLVVSRDRELEDVYLREVYPTLNAALAYRFDVTAQEEITKLLTEVAQAAAEKLRKAGYIE